MNDGTCRFDDVPELLARAELTESDRTWLIEEVDRRRELTEDRYWVDKLNALAYQLLLKSRKSGGKKGKK